MFNFFPPPLFHLSRTCTRVKRDVSGLARIEDGGTSFSHKSKTCPIHFINFSKNVRRIFENVATRFDIFHPDRDIYSHNSRIIAWTRGERKLRSRTVTERKERKEGRGGKRERERENEIDGNRREQQNLLLHRGLASTRGFVDRCHGTRTMEPGAREREGLERMK